MQKAPAWQGPVPRYPGYRSMVSTPVHLVRIAAAAVVAAAGGCQDESPRPTVVPATAQEGAATPWRELEGSAVVALPPGPDEDLAAAIRQARATAEAARRQFGGGDDGGWAVKWAAPTADGHVEHVWVVPLAWSRFRIEGRLASPPQRALTGGWSTGDLVSFPAEELSDWLHRVGDGTSEGGFTVHLLEERFGPPPEHR